MNNRNMLDAFHARLRQAVKNIIMGDYASPLSNVSPLVHDMNRAGSRIAFANCRVFDGIHTELKEEMTVLVEGDRILDVGHTKRIPVPESFYRADADGQTILPGLIDNHVHACSPFTYEPSRSAVRQMPIQIALNVMRTAYSGVTTVCDMGGPQGFIKEFTKRIDKNGIPGPRMLNCYTLISPRKGKTLGYPSQVSVLNPFKAWLLEGQVATRPSTLRELKKACCKIKEDGGTHLKTTYQPHPFSKKKNETPDAFPVFPDDWMKAIFSTGRETGLIVDIHSPYGAGVERCVDLAIEAGAKIRIQHMTFDTDLKAEVLKKMRDHGFYMIPTVMVFGDSFRMPEFISWLDTNPRAHMMPEANRQIRARIQKGIDLEPCSGQIVMEHDYAYFRQQFHVVRSNTQKAHDAGIIGFGTDIGGTNTGFFGRLWSEVRHYMDAGISAFDILKYMTSVNAAINGLDDRGVVQPGKLADLIAVNGNPLIDPSVLKDVSTVMKGGVFLKYKGAEAASLGEDPVRSETHGAGPEK